jgi:hypothetical protein
MLAPWCPDSSDRGSCDSTRMAELEGDIERGGTGPREAPDDYDFLLHIRTSRIPPGDQGWEDGECYPKQEQCVLLILEAMRKLGSLDLPPASVH